MAPCDVPQARLLHDEVASVANPGEMFRAIAFLRREMRKQELPVRLGDEIRAIREKRTREWETESQRELVDFARDRSGVDYREAGYLGLIGAGWTAELEHDRAFSHRLPKAGQGLLGECEGESLLFGSRNRRTCHISRPV